MSSKGKIELHPDTDDYRRRVLAQQRQDELLGELTQADRTAAATRAALTSPLAAHMSRTGCEIVLREVRL
jgi:hypothetical protein